MTVTTVVEYDLPTTWTQVGSRSWVPDHFTVRRTWPHHGVIPDLVVEVTVELVHPSMATGVSSYDDGPPPVPVARSVKIARIYGEVLDVDFRRAKIEQMLEAGCLAVTIPSADHEAPGTPLPTRRQTGNGKRTRMITPAANEPPRPSDDRNELRAARGVLAKKAVDLGYVAHIFKQAENEGSHRTNVAVMEALGVKRAMAANYISRARAAGLIDPVQSRRTVKK